MKALKVMLVDDCEEFRNVLKEFLQTCKQVGVIEEAVDGLEAVRKTFTMRPNLILMDISMPRMDGFIAAGKIKKKFPETAVVFVSLYDEYQEFARSLNADGFVSKSSLAKELPRLLRTMVRRCDRRMDVLGNEKPRSEDFQKRMRHGQKGFSSRNN